jgi:hypothetical protein
MRLGLVGHGLRDRQVRGPRAPSGPPITVVIPTRRFLCVECAAVVTVAPRGVVRRRHFGAAAIGLALFLFGVLERSARGVQRAISGWGLGASCWRTLARWIEAARSPTVAGRPCRARGRSGMGRRLPRSHPHARRSSHSGARPRSPRRCLALRRRPPRRLRLRRKRRCCRSSPRPSWSTADPTRSTSTTAPPTAASCAATGLWPTRHHAPPRQALRRLRARQDGALLA